MKNQKEILVENTQSLTLKGVNQLVAVIPNPELNEYLSKLYQASLQGQSIIFCGTKHRVDAISSFLISEGYHVAKLTSDLNQKQRQQVMEDFRSKKKSHLVTTNLLARGFDQRTVTLVINIGIPYNMQKQTDCETYLHRIGRTGRMGDVGIALNIIDERDQPRLEDIKNHFKTEVKPLKSVDDLPSMIEDCIKITQ